MIKYLIIPLTILTFESRAQSLKFNGMYESQSRDSNSYFIRFYADGIVLSALTESGSKELVKGWLNYENRKKYTNGFYFIEGSTIFISLYDPYTMRSYIEKGFIKYDGKIIELVSYFYSDGMVKKSPYNNEFNFKQFD
jgi:hypothetical protein